MHFSSSIPDAKISKFYFFHDAGVAPLQLKYEFLNVNSSYKIADRTVSAQINLSLYRPHSFKLKGSLFYKTMKYLTQFSCPLFI